MLLGKVKFSKRVLQKLIDLNLKVVGVCSRASSNFNIIFADPKPSCETNKIPFKYVEDINSLKKYI